MNYISTLKRRLKIKTGRIIKGFKYGVWTMNGPQERLILRIVKNMIDKEDTTVLYSPETGKIYAHTQDKKYIVVFDRQSINISNHNYFFTYGITEVLGTQLLRLATKRFEMERVKLDDEMYFNEKNFLNDIYLNVSRKSNSKTELDLNE